MNFATKPLKMHEIKSDCIVLGVYSPDVLPENLRELQKRSHLSIDHLFETGGFEGKVGQTLLVHQPCDGIQQILLVGFGKKTNNTEGISQESFFRSIRVLADTLSKKPTKKIDIALEDINVEGLSEADKARYCAERISAAYYRFTHCKSNKVKTTNPTIHYRGNNSKAVKTGLATGAAVGEGVKISRELGNLPGNICTPRYLANQAKKLARNSQKISTKIISEKQMSELGMHSLLSVSAGSDEPAQLIIMEYKGAAKSQKPHVLVGKGITFDTGGISLKPGAGMDEMKFDMCGAASVFGAMHTLATLEPAINVVGVVAAAENMPSGSATKPGDIVTAMSGKTIEVLNTDAEGRLVLCDALTYVERYQPQSVVDIATLTGACVIALGSHATGLYSNSDTLAQELLNAGQKTNDRAWQMPLWDEYKKQLKSNFADLANIGGREAGSVTAACFLSHFAEKYDWAHLDIAGTAWLSGAKKGATGRPVPLLTEYLLSKVGKG